MTDKDLTLGLILNGGLARRMRGADKGLIVLAGRPMLAHAIDRLRPQCAALALSANGDLTRFQAFDLPVVPDDPPSSAGPLAGVIAGLEHCARNAPHLTHAVSLPADTPFAPIDFVARLHDAQRGSGAEIVVAASGGRVHHAAALWPVSLAGELRRVLVSQGLRKMESVLQCFRVAVVEWPNAPLDPFFNVNSPEDLAYAEAVLRGASTGRGGAL
ncbi:MAG: molybdenum cofactor guanylyltransferase MobA [Hyphomicrobiales bacterium]|nr:molybdenum cofactor guanylyltransferase MobA [Hyphomicrobiales bacterium]